MTQTRDLIKKMADFFTGEEFYEKGEDARLELSPDDVRCMNEVIKACGNAISRQAVLDKKELVELEDGQSFYCISPEDVETLPPVTPQPKTGHWIYTGDYITDGMLKCSECGFEHDVSERFAYCPNCGARMVETQESEEVRNKE